MTKRHKTKKAELPPTPEIVNGQKAIKGWGKKLLAAQKVTAWRIRKKVCQRIPFDDTGTCRDCAAKRGQLHVPGCDQEVCPRCKGQAISCNC